MCVVTHADVMHSPIAANIGEHGNNPKYARQNDGGFHAAGLRHLGISLFFFGLRELPNLSFVAIQLHLGLESRLFGKVLRQLMSCDEQRVMNDGQLANSKIGLKALDTFFWEGLKVAFDLRTRICAVRIDREIRDNECGHGASEMRMVMFNMSSKAMFV